MQNYGNYASGTGEYAQAESARINGQCGGDDRGQCAGDGAYYRGRGGRGRGRRQSPWLCIGIIVGALVIIGVIILLVSGGGGGGGRRRTPKIFDEDALCDGQWSGVGPNQQNTGVNERETVITRANAQTLAPAWAVANHPLVKEQLEAGGFAVTTPGAWYSESAVAGPAICNGVAYQTFMAATGANANSREGNPQAQNPYQSPWGTNSRNEGKFFFTHPTSGAEEEILGTDASVYAIDIATGRVLWRAQTEETGTPTKSENPDFPKDTRLGTGDRWFHTTARVTKDMVYAIGAKVWAYDRQTGQLVWSKLSDPANPHRNPSVDNEDGEGLTGHWATDYAGDLAVVDDMLIVPVSSVQDRVAQGQGVDPSTCVAGAFTGGIASSSLAAYDLYTGEERWRFRTSGYPGPEPYPVAGEPECECNGKPARCGGGAGVWSSPAIDTDLHQVYAGSGQSHDPPSSPYSDTLMAIDYRTGELVWSNQYTADDFWHRFLNPIQAGLPQIQDCDVPLHPNVFEANYNGERVKLVGSGAKNGVYKIFLRNPHPRDLEGKHRRQAALVRLHMCNSAGLNCADNSCLQATPAIYDGKMYITAGAGAGDDTDKLVALDLDKLLEFAAGRPDTDAGAVNVWSDIAQLTSAGVIVWSKVGSFDGIPFIFPANGAAIANDVYYLASIIGVFVADAQTGELITFLGNNVDAGGSIGQVTVAEGNVCVATLTGVFPGDNRAEYASPHYGGMTCWKPATGAGSVSASSGAASTSAADNIKAAASMTKEQLEQAERLAQQARAFFS